MTGNCKKPAAAGAAGAEPGEAGWREGEYAPARSTQGSAWMRVLPPYLDYRPGPAAAEVLMKWKHVIVEFEIDGETRKPRALRLTQAHAGQFGYKVRLGSRRQPYLSIPTSVIGWSPRSDPRPVEETVSADEIKVSLPFEFTP
jgi:hypothetical protein